ncbi:hypothetical protein ACHAXS_000122, partial [Conticribra weissflogii]
NVDPQTAGTSGANNSRDKCRKNNANATTADSAEYACENDNDHKNKNNNNNSNNNNNNANTAGKSKIEILVTSGPHAHAKFLLRPKPGTPCYIGRSKGKKFVKNGISLSKDAEISTTHGKFLVEAGLGRLDPTFYFVDVGSTNGTFLEGDQLEPEKLVKLTEGMELRVGTSNLKIMLS